MTDPQSIVPEAIDELERIVAAAYRPGAGLAHVVNEPAGIRGGLADHVAAASALLTAHELSGRLPYSMLAEELMQSARQMHWDDAGGAFRDGTLSAERAFAINCEAARVLCRIAALHARSDYRAAAVMRLDADYAGDATRILGALGGSYRERGLASVVYGLALMARDDMAVAD